MFDMRRPVSDGGEVGAKVTGAGNPCQGEGWTLAKRRNSL